MAEPRLEESGQCKEKAPARSWRHGISLALMYAEVITLSRNIFFCCALKVVKSNLGVRGETLTGRGKLAVVAAEEKQGLTGK
jgi:hypothetical protein